jgi:hypothetical protein
VFLVISNPDDGQSPKTQYLCARLRVLATCSQKAKEGEGKKRKRKPYKNNNCKYFL